jgi:hypothetical protein
MLKLNKTRHSQVYTARQKGMSRRTAQKLRTLGRIASHMQPVILDYLGHDSFGCIGHRLSHINAHFNGSQQPAPTSAADAVQHRATSCSGVRASPIRHLAKACHDASNSSRRAFLQVPFHGAHKRNAEVFVLVLKLTHRTSYLGSVRGAHGGHVRLGSHDHAAEFPSLFHLQSQASL